MDKSESDWIYITEQMNRLENSTGSSTKWHLAIYIYYNKKPKGASLALQGIANKLDAWAAERGLTFFTNKTINMVFRKRRKRNMKAMEITLRKKLCLIRKAPSSWGNFGQQTELGRAY